MYNYIYIIYIVYRILYIIKKYLISFLIICFKLIKIIEDVEFFNKSSKKILY